MLIKARTLKYLNCKGSLHEKKNGETWEKVQTYISPSLPLPTWENLTVVFYRIFGLYRQGNWFWDKLFFPHKSVWTLRKFLILLYIFSINQVKKGHKTYLSKCQTYPLQMKNWFYVYNVFFGAFWAIFEKNC